METVEDDPLAHSLDFIDRTHASGAPFFLWHNTARIHVWTRLSERWRGSTKFGLYADAMQELDWVVGEPYYPLYVGEKLWTLLPAAYLLQ